MFRSLRWHVRRLCTIIGPAGLCLVNGRRRKKSSPAIIVRRAPPPENNLSHRQRRRRSSTIRIATFNATSLALSSAHFHPPSPVSALKSEQNSWQRSSSAFFERPNAQFSSSPPPPGSVDKGKSLQQEEQSISSASSSQIPYYRKRNSAVKDTCKPAFPKTQTLRSHVAFLGLSPDDFSRRHPLRSHSGVSSSASFPTLAAHAPQRSSISAPKSTSSSATPSAASPCSILNILREVDADVVALQQVKSDEADGMRPLSALARALDMHYAFAESWAPEFGNAVLSRWPIKSVHVSKLADDSDWRNVLKVVVDVPFAGELHFCCTHLDHLDENWRLKQVLALTNSLKDVPHILAGDLNALDPSDYSGSRWEDIAKLQARMGKNPPRHDVMRFLKQQLGYRDAKAHISADFDSVVVLPPGQGSPGTCKYGTRVDYILASPDLQYRFVPGSYAIVSSKGTSDHHLVKVDIEPCTEN